MGTPIHRKNAGGAICRRRAANRTDLSTHRCPIFRNAHEMETPIHRKMREVQFAQTFPLIGTPIKWERPLNCRERPLKATKSSSVKSQFSVNQEFDFFWLFGETEHRRHGVYFDAQCVSAHSCLAKTPSIAYGAKQSVFGPVFRFF